MASNLIERSEGLNSNILIRNTFTVHVFLQSAAKRQLKTTTGTASALPRSFVVSVFPAKPSDSEKSELFLVASLLLLVRHLLLVARH